MDYLFKNEEHEEFFYEMIEKTNSEIDCYRKALFYILGIEEDTRDNIYSLYDFEKNQIKSKGLEKCWQTDTTAKICMLAFNLYNGFVTENNYNDYTPYNLFNCSDILYLIEGIKIRFENWIY